MNCRSKVYDAITDPERVIKIRNRNANRKIIHTYNYNDHADVPTSIMEFVEDCSSKPSNEVSIEDINEFLTTYDQWCVDQDIKDESK
mgnify:CR=1 FL=1|tara:strand:+ start:819 stop:1079 length:261 start_codon:yes stop_codon:yes gene_type:complete